MIGCWEGEVHYCCLKSYGIFYCSNVWWDHVPDANCTGVKGEVGNDLVHCFYTDIQRYKMPVPHKVYPLIVNSCNISVTKWTIHVF